MKSTGSLENTLKTWNSIWSNASISSEVSELENLDEMDKFLDIYN
jgi:hypothetical protein